MLESVRINNKKYTLIKGFKHNDQLRKSFNELTQKIYGFDFEDWYQRGYWGEFYKPYSLLDGYKIVANVSVSIMDCMVLGQPKIYIQIGTVMTDPEYRNNGLSRCLVEKIIEEWKNNCDMFFLFANDSVVNFYPKFGFTTANEYQHSKAVEIDNEVIIAEKLNMSLESNVKLVEEKVSKAILMSKLTTLNNLSLIMFYCTSFMSDSVYYIKEHDAIVIAETQGTTLHLMDVFATSELDLDTVIDSTATKDIKRVVLGFTPKEHYGYDVSLLKQENTTLFTLQDREGLFRYNKLRFQELSHT